MSKKFQAYLAQKSVSLRNAMIVAGVTFSPMAARAAGDDIDVSPIIAKITSIGGSAGTIGLAYLTVVLGVKAFKLLRSAA